jgi:hypothetical protein
MNEQIPKKSRLPKPDQQVRHKLTPDERKNIFQKYKAIKERSGRSDKEIFDDVADEYGVHWRTIQESVRISKELAEKQRVKDLSLQILGDRNFHRHIDMLDNVRFHIKHRIENIVSERQYGAFKMRGNVVSGIEFSWPEVLQDPEHEMELSGRTAEYLIHHYQDCYPRLPFDRWEDLTPEKATIEMAENLDNLNFRYCETCPRCKEILSALDK